MENLRTESFNGKLYTTSSDSFTHEHNSVMDKLLWSYLNYFGNIACDDEDDFNIYLPLDEDGANILEHLLNCDLISVVAD